MMKKEFHPSLQGILRYLSLIILLLTSHVLLAQKTVTGVVSSNDTAVVGATVLAKGTTVGTRTGTDGSFSISVPAGRTTLVITSVGYEQQEVNIGNSTSLKINLKSLAATNLNEVVVIGYGTQKRKDLTGSVSSVGADLIEKVPVVSAAQALQGRASGVQITNNDGAPGGNISILIRGIGSLAPGGNAPLYVIDGYPSQGGINNINPSDIASIDVLKDASSTAIYGIRAANGVIIITTKKGLRNRTQVSADMYEAVQTEPKKYKLLNAQQFSALSNDVEKTQPAYIAFSPWRNGANLHTVDWQNAVYRGGLTQNYSIAIRGGNDKVQSAASFGYYNQKGIVIGSYFKRFTAGLNLDYQPYKWLRSSTSIKYSNQDANTPLGTSGVTGTGGLFNLIINPPTLDSGNKLTNQIKDANGNYGFYNPINPNTSKFSNPIYNVETNKYKNISNYLLANSSLEVSPFDGLRIKTSGGVNVTNYSGSYYQPEDGRAANQYPGAIITPALYTQNINNSFEWLWENTVAYDKTFGQHTINFVGGVSAQKNTYDAMGGRGIPPNGQIRDLSQVTNPVFNSSNVQAGVIGNGEVITTLASLFGRLSYNFGDKYLITGTIRRDGSSKFETGHKYGVFPSGAIAWRIKNESFLKSVGWLNDLKLRGSYGAVGNQTPINYFQYQSLYAGNYGPAINGGGADNLGYPFGGVYQNGIAQTQPANPNLRWETDYTTNVGMDAAFLKGALTVTADWFNRKSEKFLLTIPASPQTGYSYLTQNIGTMTNKGVEIALNYRGSKGKDFQYGIGVTWSAIKNRITDITSGVTSLTSNNFGYGSALTGQGWADFSRYAIGGEAGEFYGYKSLGIFQSQAQIDALNAKAPNHIYYRPDTKPGDRYFADINGDGVVNADDRTGIGSPQPKFFGGINLDASYKAWDFNLYFYGSYGNKTLNYVQSSLQSFQKRGSEGVENVSVDYYNNYWTPTRPSDKYSRALANDNSTLNNVPSSAWVENGSYLKLKNFTVGYTLPGKLSNRYSISKLRLYVSTQNLFFITKYSGLDPEVGIQGGSPIFNGVDNGIYPSSRFFTFGLNVTF